MALVLDLLNRDPRPNAGNPKADAGKAAEPRHPEKQKRPEPDGWLDCEFHELVEFAFDDHIIYSKEDALAKLPRKSRRMVREEFDE